MHSDLFPLPCAFATPSEFSLCDRRTQSCNIDSSPQIKTQPFADEDSFSYTGVTGAFWLKRFFRAFEQIFFFKNCIFMSHLYLKHNTNKYSLLHPLTQGCFCLKAHKYCLYYMNQYSLLHNVVVSCIFTSTCLTWFDFVFKRDLTWLFLQSFCQLLMG